VCPGCVAHPFDFAQGRLYRQKRAIRVGHPANSRLLAFGTSPTIAKGGQLWATIDMWATGRLGGCGGHLPQITGEWSAGKAPLKFRANAAPGAQIDRSEEISPDDGSFPLICSSSLTIASRARYTNIPPQIITSKIAPSRAAVKVMVPPGR